MQALVGTLGFRHIGVVHDEYAVSPDGMKAFGVLDPETEMEGCRFSIGLRNSHDKSMRLAMTCGYRVFVCPNMAFAGDFPKPLNLYRLRGRARAAASFPPFVLRSVARRVIAIDLEQTAEW